MTIILDQYTIPEQGSFEIRQTVDITFTAKQAQRKVDPWQLNNVPSAPLLMIDNDGYVVPKPTAETL